MFKLPDWLLSLFSDALLAIIRPFAAVLGVIAITLLILGDFFFHVARGKKASTFFDY